MKLRKLVALCAAAAIAVLCAGALAGCGPSNEEVIRTGVAEELDGLKNLDESSLSELMSGADVGSLAQFGIDAEEFLKSYLAGFDYRIDDVTVDGDKAHVTVALTCKDFSAYEQALEDAAAALAEDESFAELDEEALNQKIGEAVMSAAASVQAAEIDPVTLDYELQGNTWTPTAQATKNIAKALFG